MRKDKKIEELEDIVSSNKKRSSSTIRVADDQLEVIDAFCIKHNVSRNTLLVGSAQKYINEFGGK